MCMQRTVTEHPLPQCTHAKGTSATARSAKVPSALKHWTDISRTTAEVYIWEKL